MEAQPIVREVQDLTPFVQQVVKLRHESTEANSTIAALRTLWEDAHETQLKDAKDLKQLLEQAEASLRGEALFNYFATGNKQVAPGIVASYKADQLQGGPADFRLICFHGQPKPHQLGGWVQQHWTRDDA